MKMNRKKTMAMLLVGMMAFGSAAAAMTNVSEAHHREHRQETYADGTTNKYSHRMHEEETTHRMNLRALRYQHRKETGFPQRICVPYERGTEAPRSGNAEYQERV